LDPAYGERYRDLYQNHWWWRARTELITEKLRALFPAPGRETILDIGCGDGLFFDRLARFGEVEGLEPGAALVSSDNPHRDRIYIGEFDDRFLPGKRYSLILMLDVLEHLPDPAAALRRVESLLQPGGKFVVTVPAFMALWTNHDVLNQHYIRYTKDSFRQLAHQTSLEIEEQRYFYHWTFPAKLGVRALERISHSTPTPATIPTRWANELLFTVSRIEQKTITRLPIPFGSSLLVVATKPAQTSPRDAAIPK
jgi:2-polyprenyl-3-methyl-5-hydroxy-6-metoxy-1,4-benzoquinol methylase